MSTTEPTRQQTAPTEQPARGLTSARPKRADARRNYDRVIAAARSAFTESGAETSLEGIARRAGVGIGTLYRHFPTRQALLEAVYVEEVERLCNSAAELARLEPWEAFAAWAEGLVDYMATKLALASELFDYVDRDAPVFTSCRASLFAAGGPLLQRAQAAGVVRDDVDIAEVIQLIGGITKIQGAEPAQIRRLLSIALDGLRRHPRDD
ncbi:MAG TPA: TetR/AcrR family transcriptional regulator [Solirubrobacteraceae bacterium]|nr:TetR/AcrR family transcriptional regulator [Solirubrobacteraceae bacterium]